MATPRLFELKIFSKIVFARCKFQKAFLCLTWKAIHFHIKNQCPRKSLMHRVIVQYKSTYKNSYHFAKSKMFDNVFIKKKMLGDKDLTDCKRFWSEKKYIFIISW